MKTTAFICIAIFLLGCSTAMNDRRDTALNSALYAYQTAMRWGNWDALSTYRDPKDPIPSDQTKHLGNIQVTGYEVRQPPIFIQEQQATQVVEIQYVLRDEQRLYTVLDRQDWSYDANQNLWRLKSPFPTFH